MRQYPRRVYKDNDSKSVMDETEEIQAASDGWECASNPEKIALKEKAGKGILRKDPIETIKEEINVKAVEMVEKELSPQKRAAITRKKNKESKEA